MNLMEWNFEEATLVGITLYFILAMLFLAVKMVSHQIEQTRATSLCTISEKVKKNDSGKPQVLPRDIIAVRLISCWIFSFSVAFTTFARLQCGSDMILPRHLCSFAMLFLILCESHLMVAEQFYHRLILTGKDSHFVIIKFVFFCLCLPAFMMPVLYCILGKRGFEFPKVEHYTPQTTNYIDKSENATNMLRIAKDGEAKAETCWIEWDMTSVKVTSAALGASVLVCTFIILMNVVTLLRIESRGIQIPYKTWWGIATRFVFPIITASKWASVAFYGSCQVNFYNVLATTFVTPVLVAIMFNGPRDSQAKNSNIISATHRHRRREKRTVTLDVIELGEAKETDPMMLHHDVLSSDVTRHVTHEYQPQTFLGREKEMGIHKNVLGENHYTHDYHDTTHKYFMKGKDRHSTDVDDGVISSDGDYDTARQNLESLEADIEVAPSCDNTGQSSDPRLSHAESTDSGMGFSDNAKDGEASRLSANDGYGHFIKPLQEEENRKSLIDGDAEYDEVMEFISTPTEDDNQRVTRQETPTFSTFQTPRKTNQVDTSGGDANPKYASVDIAKILHTRRRHQHSSTLRRQTEEEKMPEDGYNSLRKKTKSKNYSISAYGTFRRNRKSSGQQNTDSWASRPSSTCNENEDVLSPLSDRMMMSPSTSFDRRSNYSAVDIPYGHYHTLKTRRSDYSSDLMMTSNVNDDVMGSSATIDRRTSWKSKPKSPDAQNSFSDMNNDTNRWSWLSNSSNTQSQTNEKPPTGSKNPWKIFRRLLGGGESKQKVVMDGTMSSASLSTRTRPSSLFRRFSTKKTNKNPLNKRRNSVPTKSEWDVHAHDEDTTNIAIHIPVMDAGKQRPVAPKSLAQKSRSRRSTRLMSFRGGKNRNSKRLNDDPMSKGLSISSPQLAVNAIDPTRNYSEHQLLNLKDLSINPGRK